MKKREIERTLWAIWFIVFTLASIWFLWSWYDVLAHQKEDGGTQNPYNLFVIADERAQKSRLPGGQTR